MSRNRIPRRLGALGRILCLGWTGAAFLLCVGPGAPAISAPEGTSTASGSPEGTSARATLALGATTSSGAVRLDSVFVQPVANGEQPFAQPLGVAVDDAHGEIVVANTGLGRVEFFGRGGEPRGYFVHRVPDGQGGERIGIPTHVAVTADGRLLVVDAYAPWIDVCDFRGISLGHLTLPAPDDRADLGDGAGPLTVAPDGRVIVASRGKHPRVYVLDSEGRVTDAWGTAGAAPGQLRAISGIAVTPEGQIVVTCLLTELGVQVFDAHGGYLRGFGPHDIGPGRFSQPDAVVATPDSRLWVTDMMRHNVQVFDSAGTLLGAVGSGQDPDDIFYPSALASDGRGMFALVESGGNRLRVMWIR